MNSVGSYLKIGSDKSESVSLTLDLSASDKSSLVKALRNEARNRPPLSLYHHNRRVNPKALADYILQHGHKIRNAERFFILPNHDWGRDDPADAQYIYERNGFYHIDNFFQAEIFTGEKKYYDIAQEVMIDWIIYNIIEDRVNFRKWSDITSGTRAMFLAYCINKSLLSDESEDDDVHLLVRAGVEHLNILTRPIMDAGTNHALFVMGGIVALCAALPQYPSCEAKLSAALRRLEDLFHSQFGDELVHREQSPYYHLWVSVRYSEIASQNWAPELRRLLTKVNQARRNFVHFFHPDGRLTGIGDSCEAKATDLVNYSPEFEFLASAGASGVEPQSCNVTFEKTGYAIRRSPWNQPLEDQSYLIVNGSFQQLSHKQADDLTFEWSELGRRIVVDSGKLNYDSDPYRAYMLSTRAHNTVQIDDTDFPLKRIPYGSAIRYSSEVNGVHFIKSKISLPYKDVVFTRWFAFKPGAYLLVYDDLQAVEDHVFTQHFHFAPDIQSDIHADGEIRLRSADKKIDIVGRELLLQERDEVLSCRGQNEPQIQGWHSPRYGEIEASDVLSIKKCGNKVQFATLFTLVHEVDNDFDACADIQDYALKAVHFNNGSGKETIRMPSEEEMIQHGFDHKDYWIKRHEEYEGDWRSVGRLALTHEENRASYSVLLDNVQKARDALFSPSERLKVLDLACGVGRLSPLFAGKEKNYLGVDVSPLAVKQAKEFCPEADFVVGSITDFGSDSGEKYDLVIASYVMVHMVEQYDWLDALSTLKRNLSKGGAILLMDTIPESTDNLSRYAVRRSKAEYEAALAELSLRFTEELVSIQHNEFYSIRQV